MQNMTIHSAHRRIHFVDIENEVGGWVTPLACDEFAAEYRQLSVFGPMDQIIVGVSPYSIAATYTLPPGWRRVLGPQGPQSADKALLAEIPDDRRLASFTEVVIASGDRSFLTLALRARLAGLGVTLVTNRLFRPHWKLYKAASQHLTISVQSSFPRAAA